MFKPICHEVDFAQFFFKGKVNLKIYIYIYKFILDDIQKILWINLELLSIAVKFNLVVVTQVRHWQRKSSIFSCFSFSFSLFYLLKFFCFIHLFYLIYFFFYSFSFFFDTFFLFDSFFFPRLFLFFSSNLFGFFFNSFSCFFNL